MKKFTHFLLSLVLILPCLFLFACGDDPTINDISVELSSSNLTMTDNEIEVVYGNNMELQPEDFRVFGLSDEKVIVEIPQKTETTEGYTFLSNVPDDAVTPVGEYTISISYGEITKSITLTVKKETLNMSGVQWNYTVPFIYDDAPKTVAILESTLPVGVTVSYSGVCQEITAGEYTATAHFSYTDGVNFNKIDDMVLNWKINRANYNLSSVAMKSFVYNGTEQSAEVDENTLPNDVIVSEIKGENLETDAGEYTAIVSFETLDTENYNTIEPMYLTWNINRAVFTVEDIGLKLKQKTFIYDGTPKTVEIDYDELNEGFEVVDFKAPYSTVVGHSNCMAEIRYTGDDASNYQEVGRIYLDWQITKPVLTINLNDSTIKYGEDLSGSGYTVSGLVDGDDESVITGTIDYYSTDYYVGAGVGEYSISASGLETTKYVINYVPGILTVGKTDLIVKASDTEIYYNDAPVCDGVEYTGFVASDNENSLIGAVEFDYTYEQGDDIGTYTITPRGVSSENYNITFQTGNLVVSPAVVDVCLFDFDDEFDFSYTGSPVKPELADLPEYIVATSYKYTQNDEEIEPIDVGTYVVEITLTCTDSNYVLSDDTLILDYTIEQP